MEADEISNALEKAVRELTGLDIEPEITINNDLSKGDFSTNAAMIAFGKIKNNPFGKLRTRKSNLKSATELAEEIVRLLNTKYNIQNTFRLIEAKPPGFINYWISSEVISRQIVKALKSSEKVDGSIKSKLIFEFGDPNPFKDPHIGHLRNFAIGESLCRLLEENGNEVIRASYQGDVGMHVAKAIWGIKNQKLRIKNLDEGTLEEKVRFLAGCYTLGSKAYDEDEKAKKEIISINKKIYSGDTEVYSLWQKGRRWSLDHFEELYKKLGIKYDKYYFESQTAPLGKEIVEKHPDVFEKHDGALIFRGEKQGLHTRVFVTKEGNATYEGKDLALAVLKDQDFPDVNKSIIMTANEQVEYFKVLLAALKLVDPEIADKTKHLSFGFVNLKEATGPEGTLARRVKMSSRTGNVVTANWLLEEIKNRLKNGFKEVSEGVLEELSVGAVKWSMLKFSRESNISFSIEESIQIEGNSGPYMQYAYARTRSILEKSNKNNFKAKTEIVWEGQELALARLICQFENVVFDAGKNLLPNILCNYLFNLAQNFNNFYEKEKVIGSSREEEKLFLVNAVGAVLKKGMYLLGIASPSKI